jgi:hypothetical protein
MKTRRVPLILVLAVAIAEPVMSRPASDAPQQAWPTIKLRVVNEARVDRRTLDIAHQQEAEILSRAGIRLMWLECSSGGGDFASENPCQQELGAAEFWMRITTNRTSRTTRGVLGYSELGGDGTSGSGGVFYPAIQELADSFHLRSAEFLGAAMVHEVGHLILGPDAHSQTGIMFAHWGREQFKLISVGHLSFAPQQAKLLQREAGRRLAAVR